MALAAHGIEVVLPPGWEGRIYRRPDPDAQPVLHAANGALAPDDGDFALATAAQLGPGGALMVLCEYESAMAGQPLFDHPQPAAVDPWQAEPSHMLRRRPGQAGYQQFFTDAGRAFALYVVLGSDGEARALMPGVNSVLGSLQIAPA